MGHGTSQSDIVAPKSPFYQGPFGRIRPDLPAWRPSGVAGSLEQYFLQFANKHMVEAPGRTPTQIAENQDLRDDLESEFSSAIPAGYTYFGQFVDHDITLDVTPLSASETDPERLLNFRTPRLDLDCVYGRGPEDQPYLYEHDKGDFTGKLIVGTIPGTGFSDLQRNDKEKRAIIGDMRNDENAIVAQFQLAFIKAHNTLIDRALAIGLVKKGKDAFEPARKVLRWLYQHIVWNDFLCRVTDEDVWSCALRLTDVCGNRGIWQRGLRDIYDWKSQPFMPVEFSIAAYRFGHSMARNSYQTNNSVKLGAGAGNFFPLFDISAGGKDDLRGFQALSGSRVLQWDWFLEMESSHGPFPQMARKIDTRLANALANLPMAPGAPAIDNVLPARNLVRSVRMGLPSGTDVAKAFGFSPIVLGANEPDALWYYILKEAEVQHDGERLGQVGASIVCATFAGLLMGDSQSFFKQDPNWSPDKEPLLTDSVNGKEPDFNVDDHNWGLQSIIRIADLPVDSSDITRLE